MKKKNFLSEENLKDLLENIKYNNIHIIEVSEGRENALEKIFKEIVTENVPNLGQEANMHVQEAQKVPKKTIPKRKTLRHIIIKMVKVKDKQRILKAARGKQPDTYKRTL